MKTKINSYLTFLVGFALVLANATLTFADNEFSPFSTDTSAAASDATAATTAGSASTTGSSDPATTQQEFLRKLHDELNMSKADYQQVLDEVSAAKINLKKLSEERMSLQEQLQNLDNQIKISKKNLIDVVKQVVEKENEVAISMEQIDKKNVEIGAQKLLIKDYMRMIYEKENTYFSIDENGDIDAFKFLLSDDTVGENLKKLKYLDLLNEAGQQMIDKLEFLNNELESYKDEVKLKRQKLKYLERDLANEKKELELQKASQIALLKQTSGQEFVYEQLLAQSIEQQQNVLTDLKTLSNAISFIEQKISEEGDNFDISKYNGILDNKTKALYQFRIDHPNFDGFMWPVTPTRGLSAYFRDPGYASSFGVKHNAIDIPTYQGTPILSASDGVVFKAKDNGYGYSYIILAHADGFMTVYGHVSKIMVSEGDTVEQGTIIGLSGGTPGTPGAGYMTTGAHLHFEVLAKGAHTDPLLYLDMSILIRDQVEGFLPEQYWTKWENDALKNSVVEDRIKP
jgi:murein DD-endopeptidase MepM/ murein hydrolase activator NlpD